MHPAEKVQFMEIDNSVLVTFPGIAVFDGTVGSLSIAGEDLRVEKLKHDVMDGICSRYTLEEVKDEPIFRAYRDFFWRVGVDPTKTRPASEALVRRILAGKPIPTINTAVDVYNLASAQTGIPIAAFDADALNGDIRMRFAQAGETFLGIGMNTPISLQENQVILTDADANGTQDIIAIYPYRDSDATKITLDTRTIHIVACGVPGIGFDQIQRAYELAAMYLVEFASGIRSE